jgi:uncharacterized OB-fold protein
MAEYSMISKDFYKALENNLLIGSKCTQCGSYSIPQRSICPKCHSENTELIHFSGYGRLVAFTVISVPPVKMAEAGYNNKNPYCSGIVELEEGPRISAQILDVDLFNPENIKIGMKLEMKIITRHEDDTEKSYLAFHPIN